MTKAEGLGIGRIFSEFCATTVEDYDNAKAALDTAITGSAILVAIPALESSDLSASVVSADGTTVTLTFNSAVTVAEGQTITVNSVEGTIAEVDPANTDVVVVFGSAVDGTFTSADKFKVVAPQVDGVSAETTFEVELSTTGTTNWTSAVTVLP